MDEKCFFIFSTVESRFSAFGVSKIALLDALDAEIHAIISITSAIQDTSPEPAVNNTFASSGVSGRIFICFPKGVGCPELSSAPRRYNNSRLRSTLSRFGRSRKGKLRISSWPRTFKVNTKVVKSHSWISGVVESWREEKYGAG